MRSIWTERISCRVNGVAVTVGILRRLGLQLINIHGQHDSAALFDENYHLTFLDSFAADAPLLEQYRAQFSAMQSLQREMAHLRMDESEKLRRTETLRYQIDEIERAALKPDEDTQLEARRRLLQNAEKLSDGLRDAAACLDGGDEAQGAAALLTQAERDLAHSARFDESLQPLHDTIADLMYQAQDAAEQLRDRLYRLSYSADELEQLEERLDLLHRLRRKYGADCAAILDYLARAKAELEEIEFSDERLQQLEKQAAAAEKQARETALRLRECRKAASEALTARVLDELSQLDMKKVQFACRFTETGLTQDGMDAVSFYMSANLGEALKPLSKVASGGELARIMLGAEKRAGRERPCADADLRRGRHRCLRPGRSACGGKAPRPVPHEADPVRNASAADRCAGGHAFPHRQGRARRPHVHERDAA